MPLFNIKDKNDDLIIRSHYYNWLSEQNLDDIHNIQTKTDYLKSQGFVIGVDRITEESLNILKSIEEVFYLTNLKKKKL